VFWRIFSVVLALLLAATLWGSGRMVDAYRSNIYIAFRLDLHARRMLQECQQVESVNQVLSEELYQATHEPRRQRAVPLSLRYLVEHQPVDKAR